MKLCLLPHTSVDVFLSAYMACISVGNAGLFVFAATEKE